MKKLQQEDIHFYNSATRSSEKLDEEIYRYVEETSRSSFQRGREHKAEVSARKKTHPLIIHFEEMHRGEDQTILNEERKEIKTCHPVQFS